jgi:hypothetical protein
MNNEQVIAFLKFVEDSYYYNSGCWINCETDEVTSREDILDKFLKWYNTQNETI